jgi:hypothetical protein
MTSVKANLQSVSRLGKGLRLVPFALQQRPPTLQGHDCKNIYIHKPCQCKIVRSTNRSDEVNMYTQGMKIGVISEYLVKLLSTRMYASS